MDSHSTAFNVQDTLSEISNIRLTKISDAKFYRHMDDVDPLNHLRSLFVVPKNKHLGCADLSLVQPEEECTYMCGNSLGLMPQGVSQCIQKELDKWGKMGVLGHLKGTMPWAFCDECVEDDMAKLVGARKDEVVLMNGLTVNLHLAMISFYQPKEERHKILIESKAFPSDHYVVESQIRLHGREPSESLLMLEPKSGKETLKHQDILDVIEREGDSIALILLPGVQYYTGQLFDMAGIVKAGHEKGCMVGFDLAHAVGNVELHLHNWNVDFACWCTYKFMNAGAGSIAGFFLHKIHANNSFPKLQGWWSHSFSSRFDMTNVMEQSPGAHGYRLSNPSMVQCSSLRASLNVFNQTSMSEIRGKSLLLTGYLERLLNEKLINNPEQKIKVIIITPQDPNQRGAQLSLKLSSSAELVNMELKKRGVVCDERKPDVIRVAPVPLYNTFKDVYRFVELLKDSLDAVARSLG